MSTATEKVEKNTRLLQFGYRSNKMSNKWLKHFFCFIFDILGAKIPPLTHSSLFSLYIYIYKQTIESVFLLITKILFDITITFKMPTIARIF